MKKTLVDQRIHAMAVQAGLLHTDVPITPEIRMFADLVALHCADIAKTDAETSPRGVDIDIKSAFGLLE